MQIIVLLALIAGFRYAVGVPAELAANWTIRMAWDGDERAYLAGVKRAAGLLTVFLPMLPHVHPRMASEFDPPGGVAILEPPGFAGLNYGRRTPLTTLLGQLCYGAILGAGYDVSGS
jgi:protein-S-isoprenylcysteine O-methyltransferase Ste14